MTGYWVARNKCQKKNLIFASLSPKKQMVFNIPWNTQEYPNIHRNTRKQLRVKSKKGNRKYPTVYFNTPTQPKPNPLPGIFSNTWPESGQVWKTLPVGHCCSPLDHHHHHSNPSPPKKQILWNSAEWKKTLYFSLSLGCVISLLSLPDWRLQIDRLTQTSQTLSSWRYWEGPCLRLVL